MRSLPLYLMVAVPILFGCASSPPPPAPSIKPSLDQSLAAPCNQNGQPKADDYDAWLAWMVDVVLLNYADCAVRHARTVEAWPE